MADIIEPVPELAVIHIRNDADFGLEAGFWDLAEKTAISDHWSGSPAPVKRHCFARLLWTDEALLARFDHAISEPLVADPDPDLSVKSIGLWKRDVCELFIAPGCEDNGRYFEFEVAPNGEWLDLAIESKPDGRITDWEFHSEMAAVAEIERDRAALAIRIPWKAIGGVPEFGESRRGNLFRIVGAGENRGYLAWSPTITEAPDFHVPKRFGKFIFT